MEALRQLGRQPLGPESANEPHDLGQATPNVNLHTLVATTVALLVDVELVPLQHLDDPVEHRPLVLVDHQILGGRGDGQRPFAVEQPGQPSGLIGVLKLPGWHVLDFVAGLQVLGFDPLPASREAVAPVITASGLGFTAGQEHVLVGAGHAALAGLHLVARGLNDRRSGDIGTSPSATSASAVFGSELVEGDDLVAQSKRPDRNPFQILGEHTGFRSAAVLLVALQTLRRGLVGIRHPGAAVGALPEVLDHVFDQELDAVALDEQRPADPEHVGVEDFFARPHAERLVEVCQRGDLTDGEVFPAQLIGQEFHVI